MSRSIMLNSIREYGTRQQYTTACIYAARGDDNSIRTILNKLIGA